MLNNRAVSDFFILCDINSIDLIMNEERLAKIESVTNNASYKNGKQNVIKPNWFSINFIIQIELKVSDIFNSMKELRTFIELFGLMSKYHYKASKSNPSE